MLKKAIAISLISIYCLIIFKDFIPELIYEINFSYIVKNLCEQKDETENLCMGHCYLNKEIKELLAESKETENSGKSLPISINTKTLESHFAACKFLEIDFTNIQTDKHNFHKISFAVLSNNLKPQLPPPKFLFS